MMSVARVSFWIVVALNAAPSLPAQEATQGTGLEVEDFSRLGVTLIAGRRIDDDAVREAVERQFAMAGVEMTEGQDPRRQAPPGTRRSAA